MSSLELERHGMPLGEDVSAIVGWAKKLDRHKIAVLVRDFTRDAHLAEGFYSTGMCIHWGIYQPLQEINQK
jgi:hypothetical protein